jgi:mannitol/fructose-specific phosphotransferase system IIA component (Ntr-type)
MSSLVDLVDPSLVFTHLEDLDRDGILRFFAEELGQGHEALDANTVLERLREREELGSTGIGRSIAVPHCRAEGLQDAIIAIGVSRRGVDYAAIDGNPVRVFFVVVSAAQDPQQNLRCLAAISAWAKDPENVERLVKATSREQILELLGRQDAEGS